MAAPSDSTLQNLCTFLVRVPALGAAMVESAVNVVKETNQSLVSLPAFTALLLTRAR